MRDGNIIQMEIEQGTGKVYLLTDQDELFVSWHCEGESFWSKIKVPPKTVKPRPEPLMTSGELTRKYYEK